MKPTGAIAAKRGREPIRRRSGRALSRIGAGVIGGTVLGTLATWLLPGLAMACTVCMGGQEEASRKAFVGTTAFLTFLPLLMLGVLVGWWVRRTLAAERGEDSRSPAASTDVEAPEPVRSAPLAR